MRTCPFGVTDQGNITYAHLRTVPDLTQQVYQQGHDYAAIPDHQCTSIVEVVRL